MGLKCFCEEGVSMVQTRSIPRLSGETLKKKRARLWTPSAGQAQRLWFLTYKQQAVAVCLTVITS
jgi:hypothetical protein